jgi:hypothetical protein
MNIAVNFLNSLKLLNCNAVPPSHFLTSDVNPSISIFVHIQRQFKNKGLNGKALKRFELITKPHQKHLLYDELRQQPLFAVLMPINAYII